VKLFILVDLLWDVICLRVFFSFIGRADESMLCLGEGVMQIWEEKNITLKFPALPPTNLNFSSCPVQTFNPRFFGLIP